MVEVTKEEKLRVLLQDIRRPKDTLHGRTQTDDRGGRYAAMGKPVITGSTPGPQYPKLPSNNSFGEGLDQVTGIEPPLGFDVNEMEPCGTEAEIQRSLSATPAQHSLDAQANASVPHTGVSALAPGTPLVEARAQQFKRRV
jgi:hypothetical protein